MKQHSGSFSQDFYSSPPLDQIKCGPEKDLSKLCLLFLYINSLLLPKTIIYRNRTACKKGRLAFDSLAGGLTSQSRVVREFLRIFDMKSLEFEAYCHRGALANFWSRVF